MRDPVVIWTKGTGERIDCNNRIITRKKEGRRKQSLIGWTVLRTRNRKAMSQVFCRWKYFRRCQRNQFKEEVKSHKLKQKLTQHKKEEIQGLVQSRMRTQDFVI
jgi:hypothetical protein